MAEITKYTAGEFCWTDIAARDPKAEKKFYQDLFGWQIRDFPIEGGEPYSTFLVDGKEACDLYPRNDVKSEESLPSNWQVYISVSDVDEIVNIAKASGGKIISPAFDVMDAGRMAVLQDPTGASFAVWQSKNHIGARVYNMLGAVCWRELITPNVDIAGKFYSSVFGWKISSNKEMDMPDYTMFQSGEEVVCGMPTHPVKGTVPQWITYWIVENCENSLQKAKSMGASVIIPATKIPGMGEYAVLSDPEGAALGIMQFAN